MDLPLELPRLPVARHLPAEGEGVDEWIKRKFYGAQDAARKRWRSWYADRRLTFNERIQKFVLRRELKQAQKAILSRLTRLEFARWSTKKGRRNIKTLKFAQAAATPAALYLRIDTVRMPRGRAITTSHMSEDRVLRELSLACGAPVTSFRHYRGGFWLRIERANGIGAIPRYVEYARALGDMPKSAGVLDVPLGYGVNNRFYHEDIADMPHLLIAGATGFGKSVFLFNLIVTIAQRSKPSQVQMVLVDLKGGAGLGPFSGLPHLMDERNDHNEDEDFLITPQIYSRRASVMGILTRLNYETERRMQLFAQNKCRDRTSYNRKNPHRRMPLILAVFDEIQNVMLDRKMKRDAESLLTDIASRSRAAGIHLVVATQRPSTDVITGLIKANFPTRLSFNMATGVDSRVILDVSDAAGLGRRGLLIYKSPYRYIKAQSPFVSEGLVDDVVGKLSEGDYTIEIENSVGTLDTVRWAIEENEGKYTADEIYKQYRGRGVTYDDARELLQSVVAMDEIRIDDSFYRWRTRDSRIVKLREAGGELIPVDAVTFEEIARWSIEENEGSLSFRDTFSEFRMRISKEALLSLLSSVNSEVIVDGMGYRIIPAAGPKPRRLNLVFCVLCSGSEGEAGDQVHMERKNSEVAE